jgi:hypothetical protein
LECFEYQGGRKLKEEGGSGLRDALVIVVQLISRWGCFAQQ